MKILWALCQFYIFLTMLLKDNMNIFYLTALWLCRCFLHFSSVLFSHSLSFLKVSLLESRFLYSCKLISLKRGVLLVEVYQRFNVLVCPLSFLFTLKRPQYFFLHKQHGFVQIPSRFEVTIYLTSLYFSYFM